MRRALDHLFPRIHVRPRRGWVNDPNGPVWHGGRWHLYFQYRADLLRTGGVRWGHAISDDLATWQVVAPAIVPRAGGPDADGAWSGNTVVEGDDLVAFYSGFRADRRVQPPLRARSTDGGGSFGRPSVAVPVEDLLDPRIAQARDPFVWRDDGTWWMAVGMGFADGRPGIRFYRSPDLLRWTVASTTYGAASMSPAGAGSPTGPDPASSAGGASASVVEGVAALPAGGAAAPGGVAMWECPQVIDLPDRRVVLVGTWHSRFGIGDVRVLSGERGTREFTLGDRFDEGPDFYAPSALRRGESALVWGWVREARDESWFVADGWAGMLSLPRVVTAGPGGVHVAPAPELRALRGRELRHDGDGGWRVPGSVELEIPAVSGPVAVTLTTPAEERLVLALDPEGEVAIDPAGSVALDPAGSVVIDRSAASADARADSAPVRFDDAHLRTGPTRVFVDGSVVEVFTPGGRVATTRWYPTAPPPWTVTTSAPGGGEALRAWALDAGAVQDLSGVGATV